jgi:3-hydroxymyristoyl/3-hydroxydecanoyl-(acyl carrier protein) dehydratase
MGSKGLDELVPHRAPFRFVDEVVSVETDRCELLLRLAPNDARLTAGELRPLLVVEALAQSTAAFYGAHGTEGTRIGLLVELSHVRLHGPALAGETVRLLVELHREISGFARFAGRAFAGARLLAEAELTVAPAPASAD